ncbi:MAG TPA: hypothetical protein VKU89_00025 [Solirubrobacteraceae bacterium]|nr:hypothetical protein [Solirubrobacteraceae bacterium]
MAVEPARVKRDPQAPGREQRSRYDRPHQERSHLRPAEGVQPP